MKFLDSSLMTGSNSLRLMDEFSMKARNLGLSARAFEMTSRSWWMASRAELREPRVKRVSP